MTSPLPKRGTILGWSDQHEEFLGRKPDPYISVVSENAIDHRAFFLGLDAYIATGQPSADIPIEGLEAMFYGVILVVDDHPHWQNLVDEGITGWLCKSEREFVYKASRCAFEFEERKQMATAARDKLFSEFSDHPRVRELVEQEKQAEKDNPIHLRNILQLQH